MGSNQSSSARSVMELVNQNVSNIMQSSTNTSGANCIGNQTLKVKVGPTGEINCDNINFIQTNQTVCNLTSDNNVTNSSEVVKTLQAAIDNAAESNQKSVQDFLTTALNNQMTKTDLQTYVRTKIESNYTSEMNNTCVAMANSTQNGDIEINGKMTCRDFNVGNNLQISVLANCISDQLSKILSEDKVISDLASKSETTTDTEQKGVGSVLKMIMIIVGIVCVVLLIGLVVFLLSPGAQESVKTLSVAAGEAIKEQSKGGGGMGGMKPPI